MSRQLTVLEKFRITGTYDVRDQIAAFERLGIPAAPRVTMGDRIIECVVQTHAIRVCFGEEQWSEIRDENLGHAAILWSKHVPATHHRRGPDMPITKADITDCSELHDAHCSNEPGEKRRGHELNNPD